MAATTSMRRTRSYHWVVADPRQWHPGDLLTHRFNPELGVGRIIAVDRRAIVVEFPSAKKTLKIAAGSDALVPATDAAPAAAPDATPLADDRAIIDDVKRFRSIRETGIGSFLGGRVRLFPHQLYV